MNQAQAKTRPKPVIVSPFMVEACNPRMCDVLVQSGDGHVRLRSRTRSTTVATDGSVRPFRAANDAVPPDLPGMQMKVDPAKLTYEVIDPLNHDESLREKAKAFLRKAMRLRPDAVIKGVDDVKVKVGEDRMKTLVRELVQLIESGDVRLADGPMPEDVDDLPGDYLLNPGAIIKNNQPRYEKDLEAWEQGKHLQEI